MKEKMSQYDDVKMTSYTNAIFVVVFGSVKSERSPLEAPIKLSAYLMFNYPLFKHGGSGDGSSVIVMCAK